MDPLDGANGSDEAKVFDLKKLGTFAIVHGVRWRLRTVWKSWVPWPAYRRWVVSRCCRQNSWWT